MSDELLFDLADLRACINYWPRSVRDFDCFALEEAEAEAWLSFSRCCYALESGL